MHFAAIGRLVGTRGGNGAGPHAHGAQQRGQQLRRLLAVEDSGASDFKTVEIVSLPRHQHLQDLVQLGQGNGAWYRHASLSK
jgi:hypothetical protein